MLEVRAVAKSYGNFPVVHGISFTLRPGEVCGYLGPNGSGKSTTVKMLAGLLPPTRGEIFYNGQPIANGLEAYKRRIGYVPEEAQVYRYLSGIEYLELVGGLRGLGGRGLRAKVQGALAAFGLERDGDVALEAYSKGMRQKILLAAALLHDPEVLILDEPLSGLDVTSILLVERLFAVLAARGRIVLHSSHVLDVVEKVCSRVIMLHRGRIVADDSVSNLRGLMQLPSLEQIFAQLTEQPDLDRRARELAALMAEPA